MHSYLYNLFFNKENMTNNTVFQPNITLIYNFLDNKSDYIAKCTPKISRMKSAGLLDDLKNPEISHVIEKYDRDFYNLDIEHAKYFSPLLSLIINNQDIALTDYNVKMMTKLVCKNYLITEKPTKAKVSCAVYVGNEENNKKIQVNCYDIDKKGIHYFKDPKGSVEQNESVGDAIRRELREELDLTFNIDRLTLVSQDNEMTRFKVIMTDDEYNDYVKNFNPSNIDVEITHIALTMQKN